MQQNYLLPSLRATPEASGRTGERRAVFCLLKSRPNPRRELEPRCKNTSWEDSARNTEVTDQARLRSDPRILKCFVARMELSGRVQESSLDLPLALFRATMEVSLYILTASQQITHSPDRDHDTVAHSRREVESITEK